MSFIDDLKKGLDIGGSLLDIGSYIYGAVEGKRRSKEQKKLYRRQIQDRVIDAQKAGIHPLFALGASTGVSPQFTAGSGPADALQQIGPRLDARRAARVATAAGMASAKRDEAEAALLNAQRKKVEQSMISRGHDALGVQDIGAATYRYGQYVEDDSHLMYGPPEYVRPQKPKMGLTGTEAGVSPMYQLKMDYKGNIIQVFASDSEEIKQIQEAIHHIKLRGGDVLGYLKRKARQLGWQIRKHGNDFLFRPYPPSKAR